MKFILLLITCICTVIASERYEIMLNLSGIVPEQKSLAFDDDSIHQTAFYRRDRLPFPYIATGISLDLMKVSDHWLYGGSYELDLDYLSFSKNSKGYGESFTGKTQQHQLLAGVFYQFRIPERASLFAGMMTGPALQFLAIEKNSLAPDYAVTEENLSLFENLNYKHSFFNWAVAPSMGIKWIFLRHADESARAGIKIRLMYTHYLFSNKLSAEGSGLSQDYKWEKNGLRVYSGLYFQFDR